MTDQLRPNVFPALRYNDARAAIDFLTRAFGAAEKAVHERDGVIHHAELAIGAGTRQAVLEQRSSQSSRLRTRQDLERKPDLISSSRAKPVDPVRDAPRRGGSHHVTATHAEHFANPGEEQ